MTLKPISLDEKMQAIVEADKPLSQEGVECKELLKSWNEAAIDLKEDLLSIDEAAQLLGVSKQTLRNWENEGRLTSARTAGGHRRYTSTQINKIRSSQMCKNEILLHGLSASKLRTMFDKFLAAFNEDEILDLSIGIDNLNRQVQISLDSSDGLSSVTKTFKMEE